MTPKTHNDARSLFVLSKDRDYEQLGLARSLLRGQEFANGTRMLLPEHLYAQNSATLPFPAAVYAICETFSTLSTPMSRISFSSSQATCSLRTVCCRANRWTRSCASFGTAVATS